jgi:hypothetical protein
MTKRLIPLRCRLFGHRWKPSHISQKIEPYGLKGWVYLEDVCQRCYTTEYRMGEWAESRDEYNHKRRALTVSGDQCSR